MLHRGVKFAHAAALAFSVVLAFLFVRDLDETMPLGHSSLIWINTSDGSASATQVTRMLRSFTADHDVTVIRGMADLEEPERRRHMYVAADGSRGAPAAWLHEGYPGFSRETRTDVHPITDLGLLDPRGVYFVYGPPGTAHALLAEFGELGFEGRVRHPVSAAELWPI